MKKLKLLQKARALDAAKKLLFHAREELFHGDMAVPGAYGTIHHAYEYIRYQAEQAITDYLNEPVSY